MASDTQAYAQESSFSEQIMTCPHENRTNMQTISSHLDMTIWRKSMALHPTAGTDCLFDIRPIAQQPGQADSSPWEAKIAEQDAKAQSTEHLSITLKGVGVQEDGNGGTRSLRMNLSLSTKNVKGNTQRCT